jgi:2-keto-4-pentenoate hydratase/2-oxohepta-3-ene-1,7-dioic acid hydratase in catechol pathway
MEWIESEAEGGEPQPTFCYLNPAILSGPNTTIPEFPLSSQIGCKPCVGFVVDLAGRSVSPEEGDRHVVGVTLGAVLFAFDLDRDELSRGLGATRSHDVGVVLGPALTTPDELEDLRIETEDGNRLRISVSAAKDGSEFLSASLEDTPWSVGRLVAHASESAPLMAGDVLLVSLGSSPADAYVEPGSDLRVSSDRLGNLVFRYGDRSEE